MWQNNFVSLIEEDDGQFILNRATAYISLIQLRTEKKIVLIKILLTKSYNPEN